MATINPYINFAGKTAEALEFYQSIFGGKTDVQLAKDGPMAAQTPPERQNDVFHAAFITEGFQILASDMMSDAAGRVVGNVYSLAIMCDSAEQLHEWFDKLSAGGKVVWPAADSEWGSIFGQVVDKFGIQWMLNFDKAQA